MNEIKTINAQTIFNLHKHFIGIPDKRQDRITEDRLMEWAENPKRKYVCIFCGKEARQEGSIMYCHKCKEYKGIFPDCEE